MQKFKNISIFRLICNLEQIVLKIIKINEEYYNLVIGRCKLCGISQLFHPKIFREDYSYFTGVNQPMIKHLKYQMK